MTHESKHEFPQNKTSQQQFVHPQDLPLTDANEQRYLTLFTGADASKIADTYQVLLGRLRSNTLSLAALYRFANHCYRYWEQQLPPAEAITNAQEVIKQAKEQCKALANGRLL
jgi:hypothetical protein